MIALLVPRVLSISQEKGVVTLVEVFPCDVADLAQSHRGGNRKADDLVYGNDLKVVSPEIPNERLDLVVRGPPIPFVTLAHQT